MGLDPAAVADAVQIAHVAALKASGGANATYIPYLAKVSAQLCGVCAVTPDGKVFEAGDTRLGFAIESISKVFTMALVMEQRGAETVRAKIGARSTGLPFNSVLALEIHGAKPLSPLVNAGAIAAVSLVQASDREDRWAKILEMQSRFAGAPIALSAEINESEQATNLHNRAICLAACQRWQLLLRSTRGPRRLHPSVLHACELLQSRDHGRYARQSWRKSVDRHFGGETGKCAADPRRDGDGGTLRYLRRLGLRGRPARQERGRRRHHGGRPWSARNRRVRAAARLVRQQRAGSGRDRQRGEAPEPQSLW